MNLEQQIWDIAGLVAKDWYRQAVCNPFGRFFLWYREAKAGEKLALPIVSLEAPNDGYKKSIAISGAWNVAQTTRKIAEAMKTLPILGTEGKA